MISSAFAERSKEYLFIVGCARSGTSVIFNYFSECDDVFLLNEDNAFFPSSGHGFCRRYNKQWESMGKVRSKGYFIPEICKSDDYWFDVYIGLKNYYGIVGSKLAFGPHGEEYWRDIDLYFPEFFSKYFIGAHFLLTSRSPSEAIYSMSKLFPGHAFGTYKNVWIKSLQMQLMVFGSLPRSRFVFHDSLSFELLESITRDLGIAHPEKGNSFLTSRENCLSYVNEESLSLVTADLGEQQELAQLERAFAFLRKDVDSFSGRAKPEVHRQEFTRAFWFELEKIRATRDAMFELA
ncbi:MAG: hypothetical protein P4L76_16520 [Beijerinckiaceae bacterium]|nr:hypothetical protein [Beijerinckiaceae bacterium]